MKLVSYNPSNNKILGEIEENTKEEVLEKVNLAKSVQNEWANLDINERIHLLKEIYSSLNDNFDKIANLISDEMCKHITQ